MFSEDHHEAGSQYPAAEAQSSLEVLEVPWNHHKDRKKIQQMAN